VQDGVRFGQLLDDADRVVALLARALGDASYRPGPATIARAELGGKVREIGRVGALDLVAHAVVADVLAEAIEPRLSAKLWSYRAGRSSWQALRGVARFVRAHRDARPDPKTRGVEVLRSDVRAYTDEIPVGDDALVWRDIEEALRLSPREAEMVRALVRPQVAGESAPRTRGVLFGIPTTTVIANLYLMPLDEALGAMPGHYARFGDDVLFASEDRACVDEAKATLERILAERGLAANPKKLRVLSWSGNGPTTALPFLGSAVHFDGTIALPRAKWSALLHDLRTRLRRTALLAREESAPARVSLLCRIANEAFDVRSELALDHAQLIADLVSDRGQLRQLDYLVALFVAEAVTGKRGVRAFRELPPRALREAGLESRVVARNRAR
jgi:hypothetical protein